MRLKHPDMRPAGAPVHIRFDGAEIEALPGETIAATLAAADIVSLRQARSGARRGPFCGMGACFDCLVTVDGRPNQRACLTKVAPGMDVLSEPVAGASAAGEAKAAEEVACDVLVVGAGPAGLSAARALARAGASVIVADERLLIEDARHPFRGREQEHVFAVGGRPVRHRHADALRRHDSAQRHQKQSRNREGAREGVKPYFCARAIHFLMSNAAATLAAAASFKFPG